MKKEYIGKDYTKGELHYIGKNYKEKDSIEEDYIIWRGAIQ